MAVRQRADKEVNMGAIEGETSQPLEDPGRVETRNLISQEEFQPPQDSANLNKTTGQAVIPGEKPF
jgi:hypothetical protein